MKILGPAWDLSTEALFDQALTAIRAQSEEQHTFLVALHERATQAVFDRATALLVSDNPLERQLAARVLRELGPPTRRGWEVRPFRDQAGDQLLSALEVESDPEVIAWFVNAIGWQGARPALELVLTLASHQDSRVRSATASNLAALVNVASPDPRAIEALKVLSTDADPEVRFDAWWALIEDLQVAPDLISDALRSALHDSDQQIREMAEQYVAPTEPTALPREQGTT